MKELISKEAAIKTVFSMCRRWDTDDPNDLKLMLLSAFQDLPPVRQWIPCSERLPEDGLYIVTTSNGQVQVHVFNRNGNSEEYWMRCNKAWMPLPEPYKGDTTNG